MLCSLSYSHRPVSSTAQCKCEVVTHPQQLAKVHSSLTGGNASCSHACNSLLYRCLVVATHKHLQQSKEKVPVSRSSSKHKKQCLSMQSLLQMLP